MQYTLRKATVSDIPAIRDLFTEMLESIYTPDAVPVCAPAAPDYYFSGGDDWICVAEADGVIVGFLAIEVHREEPAFLYYDDCCVRASWRNCGIGSSFLDAARSYGIRLGIPAAILHVESHNTAAQRLYRRHGFSPLREDGSRVCMICHFHEQSPEIPQGGTQDV